MERLTLDGWIISYDREATRKLNAVSPHGAHLCACPSCRNFVALRDEMYPKPFVELLRTLGLNPHEEYDVSEAGPATGGGQYYSGNYRFIGTIEHDPGDRMSAIPPDRAGQPTWNIFFAKTPLADKEQPLAHLEFWVEFPWELTEKPTTAD